MKMFAYAAALFVVLVAFNMVKDARRRSKLLTKYQNKVIVDAIMGRSVVKGMSALQVQESLGRPEDVDEKVLKTKTISVYKYGRIRSNQYKIRINLEDNFVVGWEIK